MYRTSIISSSNSPAVDLIRIGLEPDMLNVGWVKASTNVVTNAANSSNSWIWNVYKSPAGNNSLGKDWYISLGWDSASNANIAITCMEQWTGGSSNVALGYVPRQGDGSMAPQGSNGWVSLGSSGLPLTPGGNVGHMTIGGVSSSANALPTYSYTLYQSVTIDRIIFATSNTQTFNDGASFYAGMYDTFLNPLLDPYPIGIFNLNRWGTSSLLTNGNAYTIEGAATRNIMPSVSQYNFTMNRNTAMQTLNPIAYGGQEIFSNRWLFGRALICSLGNPNAGTTGGLRGLLKDIYLSGIVVTRGDTTQIVINGATYNATSMYPVGSSPTVAYPWMLQV